MLPKCSFYGALIGLYSLFFLVASTCPLKEWQNVAGAPGTGVHSVRIFGLALVDVVPTVLGAWWLSRKTKWNFITIMIALVFISIPVHMLLGIQTALTVAVIGYNPACEI